MHASLTGSVDLNFTIGGCKLAVAGSYVYVVGDNVLRVIDVSDPTHPNFVGPALQLAHYQFLNSRSITVAADKLYVARGAAGVEVIDISSPTHPLSTAIIPMPALAPAAAGDYLYLAGENGLDVVKPMARALP